MRPNRAVVRRALAPDVFEAFREVVYSHGVQKLAPKMGLRPGTLYNKADAGEDTHAQPTLRDVVHLTQATGDMRVLDALDEMFGRAAFDCLPHADASDEELLHLLADLGSETGEFHQALANGLRARRFTTPVLRAIRGEAYDIVSALMTLVRRLEAYVDDDEAFAATTAPAPARGAR